MRRALALVLGALVVGASATASGAVDDWFGQFGHTLAPYLNQKKGREAPRQIDLNGTKVWVAVGSTTDSPSAVRKWYADKWRRARYGYDLLAALRKNRGARADDATAPNEIVFGNEEEGGVAAFDFGEGLTLDGLKQRFARFVATSRLGELGRFHYVYCQRSGGGTEYFNLWTDDGFDLDRVAPERGQDVGGDELPDVPRFGGAVRVLSVGEVGQPQQLRIYRGAGSLLGVEAFYRTQLRAGGWIEDSEFVRFAGERGRHGMHFRRGARDLYVDVDRVEGEVAVSLVATSG